MSKRSDSGLDGILLIDKPAGWTSHDVVAKARSITGQRRIGHTGTLDPMATGLLVLCLGRATRLVEFLSGHAKRYTGVVTLGRVTATDDAEGEMLSEGPVPPIDADALERHLARFRGPILQRPPAFSAINVRGRKAYALARAGAPPVLPAREVVIHGLAARMVAPETVEIAVDCSAGTYIRSIARDLGEALGCGGHLSALRRETAGPFSVLDALTLEALDAAVGADDLPDLLLQPDEGVLEMDAALLGPAAVSALSNGTPWAAEGDGMRRDPIRIYAASGEFVGVGSVSDSGEIRASRVFGRNKSAK